MENKLKFADLLDPKKIEQHHDEIVRYFDKGGTWKELLQFDQNAMEAQYNSAYSYYTKKQYKKASSAFSYLTILDPYNSFYWMGLALSRQSTQEYAEAIVAYTIAEAIKPDDPTPHINLAQCYWALNQEDMAIQHLKKVIHLSGNQSEYHELREKAAAILKGLKK